MICLLYFDSSLYVLFLKLTNTAHVMYIMGNVNVKLTKVLELKLYQAFLKISVKLYNDVCQNCSISVDNTQ